jgi:uncharacterized protein YaeQ
LEIDDVSENRPVALTATMYTFDVDLADSSRGVYESLSLRVARHPSESEDFLLTRLLAYLIEFVPGIEFSRGLSDPEEPAITVRDLTGALLTWIEIGTPDAARLHKAAKAAARVAVYTHKNPAQFLGRLDGARIHRAEAVEIWTIDRPFLADFASRLDRRMTFSLGIDERDLYLSLGSETLTGRVIRHPLVSAAP